MCRSPPVARSPSSWTAPGWKTVEGLGDADGPDAVQRAFVSRGAFQCGYCTTGMIMLTTALLRHQPDPDEETIRAWLESNICRCTGYAMIVEAVQEAAGSVRGSDPA